MSATTVDVSQYCQQVAERAKQASRSVAILPGAVRDRALEAMARLLRTQSDALIEANERDIEQAPSFGLSAAQIDRLRLNPARLESMAKAVEEIIALPNPIGEIMESNIRPNGLEVQKVRVPLGVVFFIYESRPNVTSDAAALCLKSGNAVILRGGKEARHSNLAIGSLIRQALEEAGAPGDAVQMVEIPDRQAVSEFLKLSQFIDVAIPRGGEALIRRVTQEATMPVIKHFAGICHIYIDRAADPQMALSITENAKCQRPGVCNAAECLLIHEDVAETMLRPIANRLLQNGVELRGCARTRQIVPEAKQATDADYATEYLDLVMSVKVVSGMNEALDHISRFGSGHTEAIITNDLAAARAFAAAADSSAVIINASTRFNDGGQFGLGAEIGISTDKFHARGPCGLKELTSYKYIVYGSGQIRT